MKKILLSLVILFALLVTASPVSAYGGGGVTPPVYDNPHSPVILQCTTVTRKLPFNQQISYPKCKVVKNPEFKAYNNDFKQRIKDFVARIRNGGN